jgi:hypothetical protein
MLNKFLKRQKQPPSSAAPVSPAGSPGASRPASSATFVERRRFPRPLPLPEVIEHDWDVWVNETQGKNPK